MVFDQALNLPIRDVIHSKYVIKTFNVKNSFFCNLVWQMFPLTIVHSYVRLYIFMYV